MIICNLKLIYLINHYQSITLSDLKQHLQDNHLINSYIIFINLLFDSQLDITDYTKLKEYIITLSNQYFSINPQYTNEEKQWLILYTLLKVQGNSFINTQYLIQEYEHLPILNTNDILINWIIYKTKLSMLDYYAYTNNEEKLYQLIDEINSFPDEIKSYNP